MTEKATHDTEATDRWPQTQQLILLAFHDDQDVADLAGQELLDHLRIPALPLEHNGQRKVIRKVAQQSAEAP